MVLKFKRLPDSSDGWDLRSYHEHLLADFLYGRESTTHWPKGQNWPEVDHFQIIANIGSGGMVFVGAYGKLFG